MGRKDKGWRYCAIRKTRRVKDKTYHWYDIHEVYEIDGKLHWTEEPVYVGCEELNEVRWALAMMLADTYRTPVYEIRKDKLIPRKEK